MAKPDVELVFNRGKDGYITSLQYTIHNREPDNYPPVEFIEILNTLFFNECFPKEKLQPVE